MSLLKQAAKQIGNQNVQKALNAFITPFGGEEDLQKLSQGQEEQLKDANAETRSRRSPIDGQLIAVKDNICTSDFATTCGSSLLQNYRSPYAATIVIKLKVAGALLAGTTNLDEFGMGSDSIHSSYGIVKNPHTLDGDNVSAGGSSGGSAVAVATRQCYAALGTDTGGSVRLPAAYNGIVGFKPSYGMISRWGVTAYANSLDTVGVLANCVSSAQEIFDVINGYDPRDPTSISLRTRTRIHDRLNEPKGEEQRNESRLRIGVPAEYNTKELQPIVREVWNRTLRALQRKGHSIHPISLPATKMALAAYYILAPAEASSNLAKYDGARYGTKSPRPDVTSDVLFSNTRGQGLGEEVRRRILLGAYSLSAGAIDNYFIQAQRVRRLVQQDFNNVFTFRHPMIDHTKADDPQRGSIDFIIAPTAQSLPPKLSDVHLRDPVDAYSADVLTVPASLAGLPAINVPVQIPERHRVGESTLDTIGMQIIGQYGTDLSVLDVAKVIETLHSMKDRHTHFDHE